MTVRLRKLWLWKKLVVTIVFSGVVTLLVLINQSENWLFINWHLPVVTYSPWENKGASGNVSAILHSPVYTVLNDKIIMRRHPYITDSTCQNFSLSLYEDGTYELAGLVSFPGSGNTWTRHLIHLATGVYTGSYYFDMELFSRGFLGEREIWHSGRTIVQKFHEKYDKRMNIDRAILLVREPFPAILSFANYLEAGHTGNAYHLPYHHKDWPNFLLQSAYNWLALAKSWIESPVTLLVIHYEQLRIQPVENLEKMCKFLNHSCPHLASPCFKKKMEGSFHRTNFLQRRRVIKDQVRKAKYPPDIEDVINRGIDHLDNLLHLHGYEQIPFNLYQHYSPENVAVPVLSHYKNSSSINKQLEMYQPA